MNDFNLEINSQICRIETLTKSLLSWLARYELDEWVDEKEVKQDIPLLKGFLSSFKIAMEKLEKEFDKIEKDK